MCCSSRTDKLIISFIAYFIDNNDGSVYLGRNHDGDALIKILSNE